MGRSQERLDGVVAQLPDGCLGIAGDLTSLEDCRQEHLKVSVHRIEAKVMDLLPV